MEPAGERSVWVGLDRGDGRLLVVALVEGVDALDDDAATIVREQSCAGRQSSPSNMNGCPAGRELAMSL